MADDGSFVVTWSSRHQDGSGWGVYYRIFNADGTPRTDERLASSSSINSQFRSRVGMDAQGNFAIAWSGFNAASSWDVYFRRFDRLGQPRGPEQQVNTRSAGHQRDPDLAMAADGRFIISWTSGNPNASGSSAAAAGMCMLAYTTPMVFNSRMKLLWTVPMDPIPVTKPIRPWRWVRDRSSWEVGAAVGCLIEAHLGRQSSNRSTSSLHATHFHHDS